MPVSGGGAESSGQAEPAPIPLVPGPPQAPPIICNLSGTVPTDPVLSKYRHVYERRFIEAYLEAQGAVVLFSGFCNCL